MPYTIFESPFGELTLVAGPDHALRHLYFPGTVPALDPADHDPEALAAPPSSSSSTSPASARASS